MFGIHLIRNDKTSLSRQIYNQFKQQILTDQLKGGQLLPSTRELARNLSVSRNTVVEAYELLFAEGFIENRQGAASRVIDNLNIGLPNTHHHSSDQTRKIIKVNFKTGQPDLSAFPKLLWGKVINQTLKDLSIKNFGYRHLDGYQPLKKEIASWLYRHRGINAPEEHIFICSGATAGLSILSDILYKDYPFAIENPSHPGFKAILDLKKIPIRWASVDEHGLDIALFDPKNLSAVYVTPSHQFPLGGILDATRRTALIRLARKHNFYIIEDDYDSEFRYHGAPISPIYSLDPSKVIYIGTFSKTVFPALRIGFAILPPALHPQWKIHRQFFDVQNPILEQAALAEFLHQGKMDQHVRTMRKRYAQKREILLESIEELFTDDVRVLGDAAGLHLVLELENRIFDETFERKCQSDGVLISRLSQYCANNHEHQNKLLLGYGHLSPDEIQLGLKIVQLNILQLENNCS